MTFKPIDAKRDEFRKYLEHTGVLEAISKIFVKLLQLSDRPENAIEFICTNLGASKEQADTNQYLRLELEDARIEIARLKRVIEKLEAEKQKITSTTDEDNDNDSKTNQNKMDDAITKTNENTTNDETLTVSNENNPNKSWSVEATASSSEESVKSVSAGENENESEPPSEKQQETAADEEKN